MTQHSFGMTSDDCAPKNYVLGLLYDEVKNFIRKKEDFECSECGEKVVGDGYTDHCPKCLWGKHVDKEIPGDRASECGGRLEPISATYHQEQFKITYKCQKCGYIFRVREGKVDNRKLLIELGRESFAE